MRILLAIVISLLLLLNPGMNAYAAESQTASSDRDNPCRYSNIDITNSEYAGFKFTNPDELSGDTITVDYGVNKIAGCDVKLRSYNGKLVGPTIRVNPGGTIHLKFINNLILDSEYDTLPDGEPQDDNGCKYVEETIAENRPHNFNITNFHTHGLHVDPNGCSDNALRVMRPRKNDSEPAQEYEIRVDIPEDHTSGTFWYHAHLHGSTALQVSSGMAGALIVEPDSPKPADDIALEDIRTLEDIPAIAKADEKIFMLQQIVYDQEGEIKDYDHWGDRKRRTTINGQIVPVIKMRPGEVQRWRFIHAGVAESINLEVRNRTQSREINLGEQIPLHEIAIDSIPLGQLDSWAIRAIELEAGYRTDVLFKAPIVSSDKPEQEYNLIDRASIDKESLSAKPEPSRILAKVIVEGTPDEMDLPTDIQLAAAKKADAPEDIDEGKIVGTPRKVVYSVHQADPNCTGGKCAYEFTVNDKPFNPQQKRTLRLDDVERWDLSVDQKSKAPNHPFHIHVNPFEYVRKGPDGRDETIWRDTLMVRQGSPEEIVTRYDDFTGKFVQHCHILSHEDQGMMELLEIVGDT